MKRIQSLFILLVLFSCAFNVFSQEDTMKYNTDMFMQTVGATENCDVYLSDSKLLKDVSLVEINDSSLYIYKEGFAPRRFGINSVKKVTFKKHAFWTGAAYGFGGTVVILGLLGLASYRGGGHPDFGPGFGFFAGIVLGIPVGVITGLVSEFAADDDVYTFPGNNLAAKTKRLQYILNKHKK